MLDLIDFIAPASGPQPDWHSWQMNVAGAIGNLGCNHLYYAIGLWPGEVMQIMVDQPAIGGMFPPESMDWAEWIGIITTW